MNRRHITITDKSKCCGCGACVQKCPQKAISLSYDKEGFKYPVVNNNCIDCGLCINVCHLITPKDLTHYSLEQTQCYGGFNKEDKVLNKSSSGGIFWPLVEYIISINGVVYGAELHDSFEVIHKRGETLSACIPFMKSKYLQSDTLQTYNEVKKDLLSCQIAGLYAFLNKDYDNLYTCEVICHGVPSRSAFDKWLIDLEKMHGSKAISMVWRDKIKGWEPNRITYNFSNGTSFTSTSQSNLFQRGFLDNLYLRPSCYHCKYAKLPRIADISLADFWGYKGKLKEINHNKGLSIILLSSDKGVKLFNKIKDKLQYQKEDISYVMKCSRHVHIHPVTNVFRKMFFKTLSNHTFTYSATKYIYPNLLLRIYRKIIKSLENDSNR